MIGWGWGGESRGQNEKRIWIFGVRFSSEYSEQLFIFQLLQKPLRSKHLEIY